MAFHKKSYVKLYIKPSLYYGSAEQVTEIFNNIDSICSEKKKAFTDANIEEIKNEYSWEHLVDMHEQYFKELLSKAGM